MPRRVVGHYVPRPGREPGDEPVSIPVAKDMEGPRGIPKREAEVTFYSREYPLESIAVEESASAVWADAVRRDFAPETAELYDEHNEAMGPVVEWIKSTGDLEPTGTPTGEDVTEKIRQKARELGYGEVGFTQFDRHYVYQSKRRYLKPLPHAICLALEQDYEATQTIPSLEAERAQGNTYHRQAELTRELADYILSLGYRVQASGPVWHYGPMIPMFVEAGLGQLGANGQLLSPHFGSRARLQILLTDAKVTYDRPVDYGIHKFCDLCQVCVIRCPGRALEAQKLWYRGVEKNKLIFKRCRPVMTRYSGCGVCMKVCPIQRYGMKPVMEHYIETGDVLGKGTDNLEGYSLPDKGYMRPGRLPQFNAEFFNMPLGRYEDQLVKEFKDRLREVDSNGHGDEQREMVWRDFREKMEEQAQGKALLVDMGMDLAE